MLEGRLGFYVMECMEWECLLVRVLWIEREEREKMVMDLVWVVVRRGRVGCGEEY